MKKIKSYKIVFANKQSPKILASEIVKLTDFLLQEGFPEDSITVSRGQNSEEHSSGFDLIISGERPKSQREIDHEKKQEEYLLLITMKENIYGIEMVLRYQKEVEKLKETGMEYKNHLVMYPDDKHFKKMQSDNRQAISVREEKITKIQDTQAKLIDLIQKFGEVEHCYKTNEFTELYKILLI